MLDLDQYDLITYVRQQTGQVGMDKGRYVMFRCPLSSHGTEDKSPSFAVYKTTQSWYCFKENEGGNIIQFIMHYFQVGVSEAYKILEGKSDTKAPVKLTQKYDVPDEVELDTSVYKYYQAFQPHEAIDSYCASRAISPKTADYFQLGMRFKGSGRFEKGEWKTTHLIGGKEIGLPMCRYLTIPTIRFGEIVHIAYRRDDKYANALFMKLPEHVRDALIKKYKTERDAIELCWPRFTSEYGSKPNIFNSQVLGRLENEQYLANKLPYVIITEAQLCAMSLTDKGYIAIAARPFTYIDWWDALEKVGRVFLAQGNDPQGRINNGKFASVFGKKGTEVIFPIAIKDANDLMREGDYENFWHNYGIEPCLEKAFVKQPKMKSVNGSGKKHAPEIL